MKKELPGVFANTITKKIDNNKKVYMGTNDELLDSKLNIEEKADVEKKNTDFLFEKTISQKINDIFKSRKYVYKIPVRIVTDSMDETKFIIGKNSKNLITIDNELIEIDKISDIYVLEQEKNE